MERGNGTVKYEFYYAYDGPPVLGILNHRLQRFVEFYNTYRPHQSLDYETPMDYYKKLSGEIKQEASVANFAITAAEANIQQETHTVLQQRLFMS